MNNLNIFQIAKERWLTTNEIFDILIKHSKFNYDKEVNLAINLTLSIAPPINPKNGDIFLFDKLITKDFKNDGIEYVMKKGEKHPRIREDFVKYVINEDFSVIGFYTHKSTDPSFRRRCYKLSNPKDSSLVFVHYRCYIPSKSQNSHYFPSQLKSNPYTDVVSFNVNSNNNINSYNFQSEGNASDENEFFFDKEMLETILEPWNEENQTLSPQFNILNMSQNQTNIAHQFVNIEILDFAPSKDEIIGGSKVIITLNNSIENLFPKQHFKSLYPIAKVSFGGTLVDGEFINNTTIRCYSPSSIPGKCELSILLHNNYKINSLKGLFFEYKTENRNNLSNIILPSIHSLSLPNSFQSTLESFNHVSTNNNKRFISSVNDVNNNSHNDINIDRTHRIRIVERLGMVKNALTTEDLNDNVVQVNKLIASQTNLPQNNIDSELLEDYQWIDDIALSKLSDNELEKVMNNYIKSVFNNLVQIVSIDDELVNEINNNDSFGFSLLHYCCMYNFSNLVPMLLSKGSDINHKSACGSTPLHFAAAHNNIQIVQLLVEMGAKVHIADKNNLTPIEKALKMKNYEITRYLLDFITNKE